MVYTVVMTSPWTNSKIVTTQFKMADLLPIFSPPFKKGGLLQLLFGGVVCVGVGVGVGVRILVNTIDV